MSTQRSLQRQNTNPGGLILPPDTSIESANSSNNANEVNASLKAAAASMHLLGPAPSCPRIAEDCEVMFSRILVDPEDKGQVYPISGGGGKLGLGKVPLEKIALAAGITWDAEQSRRDDNATHPYYCEYTAVGSMFDFDGRTITLIGTKAIDLRDGAAMWQDAHERARTKAIELAEEANNGRSLDSEQRRRAIDDGYKNAEKELRHARIHILSLAQSKARLRAIRSIGLKSSYTKEELASKPFVAVKLIWTGRSTNPATAAIYAQARAEHFLGTSRRAYGNSLPPSLAPRALNAPPSISDFRDEDDDFTGYKAAPFIDGAEITNGGNGDEHKPESTTATANAETNAPKQESQPQQTAPSDTKEAEGFTIRFGRDKGKRLIDVKNLSWLIDALTASIEDETKAQYLEQNKRDRAIILREQERRRTGGGTAPAQQSSQTEQPTEPRRSTLFDE